MNIALTGFDYIVFITIILSTFFAFLKGFIRTTISFFSWFIGFYAAYFIYPALVPFLSKIIANKNAAVAASCLTSYMLSVIVISFISGKLVDLTKNIRGGLFDRALGLAFGFLRGCLLVSILFFVIIKISPLMNPANSDPNKNTPEWLKESYSYTMLNEAMKLISSLIPSDLSHKIHFFPLNDDENNAQNAQARKLDKTSIKQLLQLVPDDVLKNFDASTIAKLSSGTMDPKQARDLLSLITNSYKNYADKQSGDNDHANNLEMLKNYFGEKTSVDNMSDSNLNISIPLPDMSSNNDDQSQNTDGSVQPDPDSINGNKEFVHEQLKKIDEVLGDDNQE